MFPGVLIWGLFPMALILGFPPFRGFGVGDSSGFVFSVEVALVWLAACLRLLVSVCCNMETSGLGICVFGG